MLYESLATNWKKSRVFHFACGLIRNFTLQERELMYIFLCQKNLTAAKPRPKHFYFLLMAVTEIHRYVSRKELPFLFGKNVIPAKQGMAT